MIRKDFKSCQIVRQCLLKKKRECLLKINKLEDKKFFRHCLQILFTRYRLQVRKQSCLHRKLANTHFDGIVNSANEDLEKEYL